MKKVLFLLIVAMMATGYVFAQSNISGTTTATTVAETEVAATAPSAPAAIFLERDNGYAHMFVGARTGADQYFSNDADASSEKSMEVLFGIDAKQYFRLLNGPVLFNLQTLGQGSVNNVEYCDVGAGVGVELGNFYLGVDTKVNLKNPKGVKLQADLEWSPSEDFILYGYGTILIPGSDSKNFVVNNGKWSSGSDKYSESGAGIGFWLHTTGDCFVSLDTGVFHTNNVFVTKDGNMNVTSWKTTVKAGTEKLAGSFSYEMGNRRTADNKPTHDFIFGVQIGL